MNPRDSSTLSKNFIKGATDAYRNNKWDKFISQFGTHYAYDVTMGGRATQETTYSSKSIAQMASLGVKIDTAASLSFGKLYGGAGFNTTNQTDASSYAETYSESIREYYIGGEPQFDNNRTNWQLQVEENPMPIYFSLKSIS